MRRTVYARVGTCVSRETRRVHCSINKKKQRSGESVVCGSNMSRRPKKHINQEKCMAQIGCPETLRKGCREPTRHCGWGTDIRGHSYVSKGCLLQMEYFEVWTSIYKLMKSFKLWRRGTQLSMLSTRWKALLYCWCCSLCAGEILLTLFLYKWTYDLILIPVF